MGWDRGGLARPSVSRQSHVSKKFAQFLLLRPPSRRHPDNWCLGE